MKLINRRSLLIKIAAVLIATVCGIIILTHPVTTILTNKLKAYPRGARYNAILDQHKLFMPDKHKDYIIMLGNSITYEGQWNELLGCQNILNRGIPGDDIKGIAQRMDIIHKTNPQKIFLMCGINDILNNRELSQIIKDYQQLLTKILGKNYSIYVQSVLYTSFNQDINAKVSKLNDWLSAFCLKKELTYIDLNQYLAPNKHLKSNFTYDGVHLTGEAYQIWSDVLLSYLD